MSISRKQFLAGAAILGASGVMAGTLSGCSEKPKSGSSTEGTDQLSKFKKVANYLYEVTYSSYEENFEKARSYFDKYKLGGCSSVQNGYIRGRNYDWTLDESVEFVIHVPAANGRHASVGVAALTAVTMEQMDTGNVDKDLLAIAPYITLDGINDAGLAININVVSFGEKGEWTMRTKETEDDLCPLMVPRLVLDQCGSIDEALDLIKSKDVFSLSTLDEAHFMISGPQSPTDSTFNTVVVEFIPDKNKHFQVNVIDHNKGEFIDNKPVMTNFHLTDFDGTVGTMTPRGMGFERWQILHDDFSQGETPVGMEQLMKKVYFTLTYDAYDPIIRYSDLMEGNLTMADRGDARIDGDYSKAGKFADVFRANVELYQTSTRADKADLWHTVHTSVMDCKNKTLKVIPQEGGYSLSFTI